MNRVALLPRHGMTMPAFGYSDDERFARVFRATWKRLPLHVRRALLRHWRTPCSITTLLRQPVIEVLPFLSRVDDPCAVGVCRQEGYEFQFRSDAVNAMPDDALAVLIAHELCHGYFFSVQHPDRTGDEFEEDMVRETLGAWDFDEETIDEWYCAHPPLIAELAEASTAAKEPNR